MDKIKTLIANDDIRVKNTILNMMEKLDYVEIVGTAKGGKETYDKIIDLKPEVVFMKINIDDNMNGLEVIKKSKEKLKNDIPIFNIVDDKINDTEVEEAYNIIGDKLNFVIEEPDNIIVNVMEAYRKYRKNI